MVDFRLILRKWMSIFLAACLFLGLLSSQALASPPACPQVLLETYYGVLKTDFKLNTDYTVKVPHQSKVHDQCNMGTCHLQSWLSMLEREQTQRNPNSPIQLSTSFISGAYWLRQAIFAIDKPGKVEIEQGANPYFSLNAIKAIGLMPEGVWKPKNKYEEAPIQGRMEKYLINIVARFRAEKARVNADFTKEQEVRERAKLSLIRAFENELGPLPQKFEYEGHTYTPVEFMNSFFPDVNRPVVQFKINPNLKDPKTHDIFMNYDEYKLNVSDALSKVKDLLDRGQNVELSYSHNRLFVDPATGFMTIRGFNMPKEWKPLPRGSRDYFGILKEGLHAVQIVGYALNPKTQQIETLLIKNSWGDQAGDKGYYHMGIDYFMAFATGITFFKDTGGDLPNIPNPKVQN